MIRKLLFGNLGGIRVDVTFPTHLHRLRRRIHFCERSLANFRLANLFLVEYASALMEFTAICFDENGLARSQKPLIWCQPWPDVGNAYLHQPDI